MIRRVTIPNRGENLDLDHANFPPHGECQTLAPLTTVFASIQSVIDRQAEATAPAGGVQ